MRTQEADLTMAQYYGTMGEHRNATASKITNHTICPCCEIITVALMLYQPKSNNNNK